MVKRLVIYEFVNETISMQNRTVLQLIRRFTPEDELEAAEDEMRAQLRIQGNNGKRFVVLEEYSDF